MPSRGITQTSLSPILIGKMKLNIFSYNIHGLPFIADSWIKPLATWFDEGVAYDFISLQEVFTTDKATMVRTPLEKHDYAVYIPSVESLLLNSGLLTGIKKTWQVLKEEFISFKDKAGIELIANKGFHAFRLKHSVSGLELVLINVHMQSEHWSNYCFDTQAIRKTQAEQICTYLRQFDLPNLVVGDINSEVPPHEEFVFLTGPVHGIKKHTYIPTGEDLDHVCCCSSSSSSRFALHELTVINKLKCSDHWAIHVVLTVV